MIKSIKLIIYAIIILAIGAIVVYFAVSSPKKTIEVSKGKINNVETVAKLCSVEIYCEVPVCDTINHKMMFAIQKQKGNVSFDLETLNIDSEGDTVKIMLPPEIIELYEATENNSWDVIDTKAIGPMALFHSDKMTLEEENQLKAKIRDKSKKLLYQNGTIERARKEGARNLQTLMEKVYHKPVEVIDPTPRGAYYGK